MVKVDQVDYQNLDFLSVAHQFSFDQIRFPSRPNSEIRLHDFEINYTQDHQLSDSNTISTSTLQSSSHSIIIGVREGRERKEKEKKRGEKPKNSTRA